MFKNLRGKRLLYLGGIKRAEYVVRRARKLGIYVIVADYNVDSPAKLVANEGVLISATDVSALVELCKEKRIDGIMTGYADILMPICYEVSKRMGFPCYFSDSLLDMSMNKQKFKKICAEYGVPFPKTYNIHLNNLNESIKEINYPVFIKPADASGSRGADACMDSDMFKFKFENALKYSKSGNVSVEELLTGTEFILDYILINGQPYLLSMADRYTEDKTRIAINSPNLMILPSKNIDIYLEQVDFNVREMFKNLGFKDGLVFMQGYINKGKVVFYEMGCRLGGTWPYIDEYYTSYNPLDMLFNHALNGIMVDDTKDMKISAKYDGFAGIIYFLSNRDEGIIGRIKGIDLIQNIEGIVDVMQFYSEGDHFDKDRQTDIRFISVHLVAKTFSDLKKKIELIYSIVDVEDVYGKSLVSKHYSVNNLNGYEVRYENNKC